MRRFEEQYRINEGDDVLNKENAIHQDVDLRLDAVELDAEAFRAGNRADIEAILKSLELTFGTLAAEMRSLLDQASGGLSADIIVETAARYFLTDARRAAILSDLRGGVDASGDTLAKLLALIVGVVGGAPAGRQNLKAINDAVVSNTTALNAILTGADPLIDTFAEIAAKFTSQGSALTEVMAAIGNRLRGDAAVDYGASVRTQFLANLGMTSVIRTLVGAGTAAEARSAIGAGVPGIVASYSDDSYAPDPAVGTWVNAATVYFSATAAAALVIASSAPNPTGGAAFGAVRARLLRDNDGGEISSRATSGYYPQGSQNPITIACTSGTLTPGQVYRALVDVRKDTNVAVPFRQHRIEVMGG